MIDGTRWILPSGTQAPSQNFTIPPAVLIITSGFSGSDNGTYVCSPNDMSNDPSRDVVELNAARECVSYITKEIIDISYFIYFFPSRPLHATKFMSNQ